MAETIREQIIIAVKTELETIASPTFESDVGQVYRGHESPIQVDEVTSVVLLDRGEVKKRHLRGAYENRMTLELRGTHKEQDDLKRVARLNALAGDCEKVVVADETHGGLAKKTNLLLHGISVGEPEDPLGSVLATIEIMYRVERADPFTNTEI